MFLNLETWGKQSIFICYISNISKLQRTLKITRMFLGFNSQSFTKNQVKLIVFSWLPARQKFYFFTENSWLFFKTEQLRQIFVTSFYLLFVLSNHIEKMKLFKGRHSVGYLRYMEFFYTLTLDILRMTVFLKVKSL